MMKIIKKILTLVQEYSELEFLAYHDALTGLYNRNFLFRKLNIKEFGVLYFIDLNNMKSANKISYTSGDRHIIKCTNEIKKLLGPDDIFIRYGGDEFIIISNDFIQLDSTKDYTVGYTFINLSIKTILEYIDIACQNMQKYKY